MGWDVKPTLANIKSEHIEDKGKDYLEDVIHVELPPKGDPEVQELTDYDPDIDFDSSENELYTTNTMQLNCNTIRVLCSDHRRDISKTIPSPYSIMMRRTLQDRPYQCYLLPPE